MTKPRRHLAGQVSLVTRRTMGRTFFLRPDDFINQVVGYELGKAANKHGQQLHAAMCMSNHPHLVISDTTGNRSDFMRDAMSGIARARNRDLDRRGYFWGAGQFGDTVCLDQDAMERKLIYTWLNPVVEGLVERAEDWPGFKILPRHWGEEIEIEVPDRFYGRRSPETITFTPQPPPGYDDMSLQEVKEHFQKLLRKKENQILDRYSKYEAVGASEVLERDPFERATSTEDGWTINPRFACKDTGVLRDAIDRHNRFLEDYETKRQRYQKGQTNVTFPCGTIQLRKEAPINCASPPAEEPGLLAASHVS